MGHRGDQRIRVPDFLFRYADDVVIAFLVEAIQRFSHNAELYIIRIRELPAMKGRGCPEEFVGADQDGGGQADGHAAAFLRRKVRKSAPSSTSQNTCTKFAGDDDLGLMTVSAASPYRFASLPNTSA